MAQDHHTVGRIENVTVGTTGIGCDYRYYNRNWQPVTTAQTCSGATHVHFCPHCDTCQCGKAKLTK